MTIATSAGLVDVLRQIPVLNAAQMDELTRTLQARFPDPRMLARELAQRGWLTPYQVNQLLQGRGPQLVLGSYVLLDKLGEGAMAQVFKARHQKTERVVTLKAIRKERLPNPDIVKRFLLDVRASAKLNHPNIVPISNAVEVAGTHVLVREFIDGLDLAKVVKQRGRLPAAQAGDYLRQVAQGLQYALDSNVSHGDLKPSNLLLTKDNSVVKIVDLGLTSLNLSANAGSTSFRSKDDPAKNPAQADLYSLGGILHFLLTGQEPPADGKSNATLRQIAPDVPAPLENVAKKLMALRPEERYRSPAEVTTALSFKTATGASSPIGIGTAPNPADPFAEAQTVAKAAPGKDLKVRASDMLQRMGPVAPLLKKHWKLAAAAGAGVLFMGMLFFVILLVWLFSGGKPATQVAQGTNPNPSTSGEAPPELPSITNKIGMKLVQIPAGEFLMGSPDAEIGRSAHEGPQTKITIRKPYHMSVNLVTVGQFKAFVQDQGFTSWAEVRKKAHRWNSTRQTTEEDSSLNWKNPGWTIEDDQPVVCVTCGRARSGSPGDAEDFCKWLEWKDGRRYRLPTEAEWEYACRAKTTTPFWNGTSLASSQANFNGEFPYGDAAKGPNLNKVSKIGSFPPNPFGLYDMNGNVRQWCHDYYLEDYYKVGKPEDPRGPPGGTDRVMRGGSWADQGLACRSAYRGKGHEYFYCDNRTGFRVVLVNDGN